ncbi:MAG: AMP-binding protein, partial [Actinomycetota bacterium]
MTYYPDEVPHHLTYPNTPLHSLLEEAAQRYPNAAATSFFGSTITYSELNRDANRFAHALKAAGLDAGDRVAIHLPNCPQLLISLYGTLKAGGVATMVSPLYEKREIIYQLQDSGAAIMVTLSQKAIFSKAVAAGQEASEGNVTVVVQIIESPRPT